MFVVLELVIISFFILFFVSLSAWSCEEEQRNENWNKFSWRRWRWNYSNDVVKQRKILSLTHIWSLRCHSEKFWYFSSSTLLSSPRTTQLSRVQWISSRTSSSTTLSKLFGHMKIILTYPSPFLSAICEPGGQVWGSLRLSTGDSNAVTSAENIS